MKRLWRVSPFSFWTMSRRHSQDWEKAGGDGPGPTACRQGQQPKQGKGPGQNSCCFWSVKRRELRVTLCGKMSGTMLTGPLGRFIYILQGSKTSFHTHGSSASVLCSLLKQLSCCLDIDVDRLQYPPSGRLLRLQPDCNSSDPPSGLPQPRSGGWSRSLRAAVLTDWSAFVRLSKGEAGSGQRVWAEALTQFHLSALLSAVKKRGNAQGLIIILGGAAGDSGRQFCTHRTSCPHPRLTFHTSRESISVHAEKWMAARRLLKWIVLFYLNFSVLPTTSSKSNCCISFVFARPVKWNQPYRVPAQGSAAPAKTVNLIFLLSDPPEGSRKRRRAGGRGGGVIFNRMPDDASSAESVSAVNSSVCIFFSNDAA